MNMLLETRGAHERRWKRYPAYRNSGIEWLREVPEGWKTKKVKHTTYVKGRIGWQGLRSDEFIDEGPYLITGTDFMEGMVDWKTCYHVSEERYGEDPYIQLRENDLLITKDGTIGKTAIVKDLSDDACLNSGIFLTRPISIDYITEFMYWLLNSVVFTKFIDYTKTGATINHLYQNLFVEFAFPVPSIPEQRAIAAFLDRETAKIDALAAKKERLVELLEEKRTALISHAVTKGLDPDAPMKDSGIEWLGEVPEHWGLLKTKQLAKRIQTGSTPPTQELHYYESGSVPWFGPGSFGTDLILDKPAKLISKTAVKDGVARIFKSQSTMIVTIGATIGKVGYIESPASSNQQITGVTFDTTRVIPKFAAYQIKRLEPVLRGIAPNTTLPILGQEDVGHIPFCLPPPPEQHTIATFIDRETAKIDALTKKIYEQIDKLKEYRTALISAAVTGKIDVCGEIA